MQLLRYHLIQVCMSPDRHDSPAFVTCKEWIGCGFNPLCINVALLSIVTQTLLSTYSCQFSQDAKLGQNAKQSSLILRVPPCNDYPKVYSI